jgi:hypothetical protein
MFKKIITYIKVTVAVAGATVSTLFGKKDTERKE